MHDIWVVMSFVCVLCIDAGRQLEGGDELRQHEDDDSLMHRSTIWRHDGALVKGDVSNSDEAFIKEVAIKSGGAFMNEYTSEVIDEASTSLDARKMALQRFLSRYGTAVNSSLFQQSQSKQDIGIELDIGIAASPPPEGAQSTSRWSESSSLYKHSITNWQLYSEMQSYTLHIENRQMTEVCGEELAEKLRAAAQTKAGIWTRLCHFRNLLANSSKEPDVESYTMLVDADTYIQQPKYNLANALAKLLLKDTPHAEILMFDDRPWCSTKVCNPNGFLVFARQGRTAREFVQHWIHDAIHACSKYSPHHPSNQQVLWHCTRPWLDRKYPSALKVMNGIEQQIYEVGLHNPSEVPLVHFTGFHHASKVKQKMSALEPTFQQ